MKMRLALAVDVLTLTVCAAAFVRPGGSITFDQYQKIEAGMTLEQVEDILGGPERNESGRLDPRCKDGFRIDQSSHWLGPDFFIHVEFDAQGRVTNKHFGTHHHWPVTKPSLWEQALSWLPWSRSSAPN
jgi:hypothetical protein